MLAPLLVILAGWVAGAAANWAADELPWRESAARSHHPLPPWQQLTFGWAPSTPAGPRADFRWRRPLLGAAIIAFFGLIYLLESTNLPRMLVVWVYTAYLLAVLVIDIEHRRVLNVMLIPVAVLAIAASLLPGMPGPVSALLGGALGFGLFLLLAILGRLLAGRSAMGGGDVKLAGVMGLMLGFPDVLPALMVGIALGGLAALVLLTSRKAHRKTYMAYAPYLALGALTLLLKVFPR